MKQTFAAFLTSGTFSFAVDGGRDQERTGRIAVGSVQDGKRGWKFTEPVGN